MGIPDSNNKAPLHKTKKKHNEQNTAIRVGPMVEERQRHLGLLFWLICEDFVLGGAYNFSTRRNEYCILGMRITRNEHY